MNNSRLIGAANDPSKPVELKFLCIMCGEEKPSRYGLLCIASNANARHFHCDTCLTSWMSVLNEEAVENPAMFFARESRVKCAVPDCDSPFFGHGQICQHIKRTALIDKYIENVKAFESKKLFEDYQSQLAGLIAALRAATTDVTGVEDRLASIVKKLEIESLERTLRLQMPDGRACKECGFGPVTLYACTDIRMHDGQVMGSAHAAVNNSCPQCGWKGSDWSEWKRWNGKLPAGITGEVDSGLSPIVAPPPRDASTRPNRPTCVWFLRGLCRYGPRCRFSHENPAEPAVVTATTATAATATPTEPSGDISSIDTSVDNLGDNLYILHSMMTILRI